jgi:hypothetical protein
MLNLPNRHFGFADKNSLVPKRSNLKPSRRRPQYLNLFGWLYLQWNLGCINLLMLNLLSFNSELLHFIIDGSLLVNLHGF